MCNARKPHKHADVIKAWADGQTVQFSNGTGKWHDADPFNHTFNWHFTYRIKPETSDLEKYGVEVGDVWLLEESSTFFNVIITEVRSEIVWVVIRNGHRATVSTEDPLLLDGDLIFRRGVVNKL